MENKEVLTGDLLVSLASIVMFLSISQWVDLNGLEPYSPLIALLGVIIMFWTGPFMKLLAPLGFIKKPILLTVSHILLFIGLKTYLNKYVEGQWIIFFVIGVILLNYNKQIAHMLFKYKK